MNARDLVLRHRRGIGTVLTLIIIGKVAWIVEPTVFGRLLDAMIHSARVRTVTFAWPMALWVGVFLANTGAGVTQRVAEARVYYGMFTRIATNICRTGLKAGDPPSRMAARAELSREFVSFFHWRVPDIITGFFDIVGTTIALAFYDWRIAVACFGVVLPVMVATRQYGLRVRSLAKSLNDRREDVFEVFTGSDPEVVKSYFAGMARTQTEIASWGAMNFGVIRLLLVVVFLAVLYIAIDLDHFSPGRLYAIAAYLWSFVNATEFMPDVMESWVAARDISARFRAREEASTLESIPLDD